jgi:YbbR domain-containing protein
VVIPLTVLIWVYAERDQLQPGDIKNVAIKLRSTATDWIVTLVNPEERVTLELEGPRGGLKKVTDTLAESGALDVEISDDLPTPFNGEISLVERLGRNSLFAREAVRVLQTKPATIKIRAEKKVTRTVKVQMRPEDRLTITDPKFEPEYVQMDVPQSLAGPTTRPDDLPVYVDLKSLIDQGAGTHTGKVPVVFSTDQKTWTIPSQSVTATVTIKPSKSTKLTSIPVWVKLQAHVLQQEKYNFTFGQIMVRDLVEVTGPAKAIEELDKRIADKTFTPAAVIDITPDDLGKLSGSEGQLVKRLGPSNFEMPADLAKDLKVNIPTAIEIPVTVMLKG